MDDVKVLYSSKRKQLLPNAIAFDLDETIGSFSDFHSIWARLENNMKTQPTFNAIMDLYPEFLRVDIFSVLRYIRMKQLSGHCLPIFIYTNNQCENVHWIYQLIYYLESRVYPGTIVEMFARPICAFEIRGKRIEPKRTTGEKTYSDFVSCSMLSTSHEVCFIDDLYHSKMKNRRVYYIQPPPYIHAISYREVVDRFLMSDIYKRLYPERSITPISVPIEPSHHTTDKVRTKKQEQQVTNKMMYYIREFFLVSSKKRSTKKRHAQIGNFSRKKRVNYK